MKFTYSWLLEHLETQATPQEIADKLTALGLEVEEFTDLGKKFAPFVVAEILEAEKHPNADKLRVCKVNNGTEVLQIVCGAPNARAGIKVCLAPVGALIPNGNFQIKKSKIRDVESNGMLCSATELELGTDSEGIMELGADAKVGSKFADYKNLNDCLFEIAITPNRADCLGVRGVARDLSAGGLGELRALSIEHGALGNFKSPISVKSDSYYIGSYIKGVQNKQSPEWLQNRLKSIGLNPISALVDITNFITFDLGRPLHVYDADKLHGNLKVEGQRSKAVFNALNNKSYELENELVVADDKGPVAIAGVIGNMESSVSESTKNVFLEVAYFNPVDVAKSGRKHQIDSDARYRFERAIDPDFMQTGAEYAVKLITEICGGEASEFVVAGTKPNTQKEIEFDFTKIKLFAGIEISQSDAEKILTNLGFKISGNKISVPSWRADVEGAADIAEEILRVYGYDKATPVVLPYSAPKKPSQISEYKDMASCVLASRGMVECVTYSFMEPKFAASFGGGNAALTLVNPISTELAELRPSALANLLQAAQKNFNRGFKNSALFEVGPVFKDKELTTISGIRTGKNEEKNIFTKPRDVDFYDIKADVESFFESINAPAPQLREDAPNYYHPGRSAGLYLGKNCLGYFGEIHPAVLKKLDIEETALGFEIFLDNFPNSQKKYKKIEVSDLQSVTRDFAFVVDKTVKAEDLLAEIRKTEKIITSAYIFDVYQGANLPEGKKSVALSVNIQPTDKTLTDKEIEAISEKIVKAVSGRFAAVLR